MRRKLRRVRGEGEGPGRARVAAMTSPPLHPGPARRDVPRREHVLDPLFALVRASLRRANDLRIAVGIVVVTGMALCVAATWAFGLIARQIERGSTQAFDEAVLHYLAAHRIPWLARAMLEITALGTGLVVFMIVGVAALFLWLTKHRWSATLLVTATLGGLILNSVLKLAFNRPRPRIIPWVTPVVSSSFPSGHSMNAAIVYLTVAWLAARLMTGRAGRWALMIATLLLVLLIGASRVYLGVHYPSDVIGGYVLGIAWAAFCMAMLETVQGYARRRGERRGEEGKV